MIYVLNGSEPYLIENKLKQIIIENNDYEIIRFDGLSKGFSLQLLMNSLLEVGLFSNNRLIVVKDPFFLIKKAEEKELESFLEYCKKPFYENILVFYTLENSFNEKLKIYKEVCENAQLLKYDQLKRNDFYSCCQSIINDRQIKLNKDVFNLLINYCNNSLTLFNSNLDIIELYPDEINIEFLNNMIITSNDEDVFNLINSLTKKKISESIKLSRKILANDDNINGLVALLSNQLRFLYEVSYYNSLGNSKNQIMDKTNVKSSYRIDKAFETLTFLKQKDILHWLDKLSELDYKNKSSYEIEGKERLELFIVSLIK